MKNIGTPIRGWKSTNPPSMKRKLKLQTQATVTPNMNRINEKLYGLGSKG
jgi:hypothetical protein